MNEGRRRAEKENSWQKEYYVKAQKERKAWCFSGNSK